MSQIPELTPIVLFMCKHYPPWHERSLEWIYHYLDFYRELDTMEVVKDDAGNVIGVAAVRFLIRPEDAETPYYHSSFGNIAWVELFVAPEPETIAILFNRLLERFGPRDPIMFWREGKPNGTQRYHIYRWDQIKKMIWRMTTYGRWESANAATGS